jgi:hypothetical protein
MEVRHLFHATAPPAAGPIFEDDGDVGRRNRPQHTARAQYPDPGMFANYEGIVRGGAPPSPNDGADRSYPACVCKRCYSCCGVLPLYTLLNRRLVHACLLRFDFIICFLAR